MITIIDANINFHLHEKNMSEPAVYKLAIPDQILHPLEDITLILHTEKCRFEIQPSITYFILSLLV